MTTAFGGLQAAAEPLVKPGNWTFNEYWQTAELDGRDFWMTEVAMWSRNTEAKREMLRQTGFIDRTIPGYIKLGGFFPDSDEPAIQKAWPPQYVENSWPFQTIDYVVFQGKENYTNRLSPEARRLWLGDGHPEQTYRLEPVFHFFRTGEKWKGSSMRQWHADDLVAFFNDRLMPQVRRELPFWNDEDHQWTHADLQKLSVLYVDEFWRDRMPVPWGAFSATYHLATNFDIRAVGEKGGTPFHTARGRGLTRQAGGDVFFYIWRGHEPTERFAYDRRAWYSTRGDDWGMPLELMPYYYIRPYLLGANILKVENFPANGIRDLEGDGQFELTAVGRVGMKLFDFVERHPDRGVVYSPIGLMLDHTRRIGLDGTTHKGFNLPYDDADQMNHGILRDLLFPEPSTTRFSGEYFGAAPFGEIFDLIKPNTPSRNPDFSRKKLMENYKVLFALGGLQIDRAFANDLVDYVRAGGVLAITAKDATALPTDFLGTRIGGAVEISGTITNETSKAEFEESNFPALALTPTTASVLYSAGRRPMVTVNPVGDGKVIVLAPRYLTQSEEVTTRSGRHRRQWQQKPLLQFVPDLMAELTRNATPFEVRFPEGARQDTGYLVTKKGDGWTISLFNYNLDRQTVTETGGTAKVTVTHPLKRVPFEIVCNVPVGDVMERFTSRDVNWESTGEGAVIRESIAGGEILVYEIQPQYIDPGTRMQPVNYALNKPVKSSSHRRGFEPEAAVDGETDNGRFWWSDHGRREFEMPQSLEVDLRRVRTIDHVYVQFHTWPQQSLDTRLRVYRYVVEASTDGQSWQTVIDESQNMDPAISDGLKRWFDPVEAKYVRLRVLHNTAFSGAQVVEFQVLGPRQVERPIARQSIVPKYDVRYPAEVANAPAEKLRYLFDMQTAKPPSIGWMPSGIAWRDLCGPIRLVVNSANEGRVYEKSLYAQSHSEITYTIPRGAKTFASAIGQGADKREVSVVFKVFVDDELKFESPLYRLGMPVLPAVVDVTGGQELRLVVTDGGDGILNDYAWWAEPRFIME